MTGGILCMSVRAIPCKYNATGYPTEQTQAVQASALSALTLTILPL